MVMATVFLLVFAFSGWAGEWVLFTRENTGLPSAAVWDLMKDGRGWYWFGTGGGIALFRQGKWA